MLTGRGLRKAFPRALLAGIVPIMKALHVLLAVVLVGCSGGSTGLASPTPPTFLEVETPSPSAPPAPLMNGFPTTFAPCAGAAKTVKRAAYNCLRDWKPTEHLSVDVEYHFSRSVTLEYQEKTQSAIDFAIDRLSPILRLTEPNPQLHVFVIHDGAEACKRMAQSWEGTRNQTWMWADKYMICNSEGSDSTRQSTGMVVHTDLGNTGSVWTRVPPARGAEGVWIVLGEAVHELAALSVEKHIGSSSMYESVAQRWISYITPTAISSAWNIEVKGAGIDSFNVLGSTAGEATWQPTFKDPNFCPNWVPWVGPTKYTDSCAKYMDIGKLMTQLPWNYTLYGHAMEFTVAHFGPEWVQTMYYPILYEEYAGQDDSFRLTHDRIARRIWGGTWSDLEEKLDDYSLEELKKGGVTGLE